MSVLALGGGACGACGASGWGFFGDFFVGGGLGLEEGGEGGRGGSLWCAVVWLWLWLWVGYAAVAGNEMGVKGKRDGFEEKGDWPGSM